MGDAWAELLRWRVAILDDHARSRAELRAAVGAARGEIVGEAERVCRSPGPCASARGLTSRSSPWVCRTATGSRSAAAVTAAEDCPVVLFTSHTDVELIARARAAGVMAFLLKPLRAAELTPALDLAIARFSEARALKQRWPTARSSSGPRAR